MAKPQKQEPCPKCGSEVLICAARGGRNSGDYTTYDARCPTCAKTDPVGRGYLVDELSEDGTMRSAIRGWNRWAKEKKAKLVAAGVAPIDGGQKQ